MSRKSIVFATLAIALFVASTISQVGGGAARAAPPKTPEIASTTTSTTATLTPVFSPPPTTPVLIGFDYGQRPALQANADVNGDGIDDVILVVVDPPVPAAPPATGYATPAHYRVFVTDGATGLTLINISLSSPAW